MDEEARAMVAARPDAAAAEVAAIARRYARAAGLLMRAVNLIGSAAERAIDRLPAPAREGLEQGVAFGLEQAYRAAARAGASRAAPATGAWAGRAAVVATGSAGGLAGLSSALVELPLTVVLMFAAIQKIARGYGLDPADETVRRQCLEVFGSGSPLTEDDGVDSSFLAARLMLTGSTVQAALQRVVPALAARLAQKLAAQTVPVLGAATGAAVNYAFLAYYEQMAHVRFGLMAVAARVGPERAAALFREAVAAERGRRRR
jgi:hypothetical protein